eukprot:6192749-Pleurochrysis_carterae.AAC.1
MLSRSRSGGGPPSGESGVGKKRATENVEHGGEAKMAANDAIPSGQGKSPENRSNARREVFIAEGRDAGARGRDAGMAGSAAECEGGGKPG